MTQEMVNGTGLVVRDVDYSWRYSEEPKGVVSVTIVPSLFYPKDDEEKLNAYLTGVTDTATEVWIRSGTPLARITSGEDVGCYGPYDPDATDGRNGQIEGLLESDARMDVYLTGVEMDDPTVGMRYRGDIVVSNLHVDVADATWGGDFRDVEGEVVTSLSDTGSTSSGGSTGSSISTVSVSVDANTGTPSASGSVSGSTLTLEFHNLKGETGETGAQGAQGEQGPAGADGADGVTPVISANATVDSNTGTPAVQVSRSGSDEAPSFTFAFQNLKGEKGDTGEQGPAGADGSDGDPAGYTEYELTPGSDVTWTDNTIRVYNSGMVAFLGTPSWTTFSSGMTLATLPTEAQPAREIRQVVRYKNSAGTAYAGQVTISSSGINSSALTNALTDMNECYVESYFRL